jgi:hypothetical protein
MRNARMFGNAGLILGVTLGWCHATDAAPWDKLFASSRTEADPKKTYSLSESNGPWTIMACSFSGPNAERQARDLVLELRQRYKLPAYQYEKKFDLGKNVVGLHVDEYGNPRKMRYARGKSEIQEIAVLVGDYASAEDPDAQRLLKKLKVDQPKCLQIKDGQQTSQSLAALRTIQAQILPDGNSRKNRGPMGHAFVTTNPMLNAEFFVPTGVDELALKANEGVEHCLLDCPGKYTVRVATFGARSLVAKNDNDLRKAMAVLDERSTDESELVQAAEKAHKLTVALRKRGVEAYEFHDRKESVVAVGSFESAGSADANGEVQIAPAVAAMIEKYRGKVKVMPQFPQGQQGQVIPQVIGGVQLDPQPKVMLVPKRNVRAAMRLTKNSSR